MRYESCVISGRRPTHNPIVCKFNLYLLIIVVIGLGFILEDLVQLQLPIKLPSGTVSDMYRKFRAICDYLVETDSVSHSVCLFVRSIFLIE